MRFPLRVVALALLPVLCSTAWSEEDSPEAAQKAAAKVRASLPDPKEAGAFSYDGELLLGNENAGSVRYAAEPADHDGQSVWEVSEDVAQDFGGSKARLGITLTLARDLTLLAGEIVRRSADAVVTTKFTREGERFAIERTTAGHDLPASDPVKLVVDAPAHATFGSAAVAIFLRNAPKKASARYALPWFSPETAGVPRGEHEPEPSKEARIEVLGGGRFDLTGTPRETWTALVERDGRTSELHFAPEDRALVAVVGRMPPIHVVPKGTAPERMKVDDDAPAKTWKAAFLKFGHGYHLGVEEWLDAAFHWDSLYEHETSVGSWAKTQSVAALRRAWLDEFMKVSPRRTRAAADQLLAGMLATGRVVEETPDRVVFAAIAEYGGGTQRTYHFRKIDDVWYLVRFDEKE